MRFAIVFTLLLSTLAIARPYEAMEDTTSDVSFDQFSQSQQSDLAAEVFAWAHEEGMPTDTEFFRKILALGKRILPKVIKFAKKVAPIAKAIVEVATSTAGDAVAGAGEVAADVTQ